jgi:NAD-dependent DNA ligase
VKRGLGISMVALLAAASVLALFGCGGGDEETSLTRHQFIKQASKTCRAIEEERLPALERTAVKLGIKPNELAPPTKQKQIILAALDFYESTTEQLSEMAPAGDAKAEAIIEAREETAEKVRSDPGTAIQSGVQFEKPRELQTAYGLASCG